MSINSIPRIGSRIDPFADYVGRQVPVVVRGLFAGQPIARLCTRRDAQEAFGEVELSIVEEYSQRMRRAAVPRVSRMTLARYLTYVQQHPRTRRLCTEMPLPSEMRATFSPPEHVRVCGKTALSMNLFVANRGNVATLHYDGDYSHVLLYQVYGRKRVVLIEPYRAPELQPIGNISGISLQSMAGVAQRRLLGRLGASSCVIGPGEAVFMPAGWWHYVEYIDDAMSFNLRFGQTYAGWLLMRCGASAVTQRLGARFAQRETTPGELELLQSLESVLATCANLPLAERARRVDPILVTLDEESANAPEHPVAARSVAHRGEAVRPAPRLRGSLERVRARCGQDDRDHRHGSRKVVHDRFNGRTEVSRRCR